MKKTAHKGNVHNSSPKGAIIEGMSSQKSWTFNLFIFAVLSISILFIYYQLAGAGFVSYDDPKYVRDNPFVMQGLTPESIGWAFTSLGYASNWHPVTWLSHMIDIELLGANPGAHHLMNVLLHLMNSFILFYLLCRLTGARWKSAAVAALFALHPLHVESVAWIAERKDVLSTFFLMLTLLAYVRYLTQRSTGRYVVMTVLYVFGLMAKPMLVTLPFILLLIDFWPLGRIGLPGSMTGLHQSQAFADSTENKWAEIAALITEKAPLFFLALASCCITYFAQEMGGSVSSLEEVPFMGRVANAVVSYGLYIWQTIWPMGLAVFYPYPENIGIAAVSLSFLLLFGITALALIYAKSVPAFLMGWFWYLGTLVPVIGIVHVGLQARADRYTYIPLIGIFIMVVWGFSALAGKRRSAEYVLKGVFIALLAVLMVASWVQAGYWKGDKELFNHALGVTRNNFLAHTNLAVTCLEQNDMDGLVSHSREALRIKPDYVPALCNLGFGLIHLGKDQEAIAPLRRAIQLEPTYLNAHMNLGSALYTLGEADGAASEFQEALRLSPRHPGALKGQELAAEMKKKLELAILAGEESLRTQPGDIDLRCKLGEMYAKKGDTTSAIAHYERAFSQKQNAPSILQDLAFLYVKAGRHEEALALLKRLSMLAPGSPDTYYNMACIHARLGEVEMSVRLLVIAVQKGFRDTTLLKNDPDLMSIRNTISYKQLVKSMDQRISATAADPVE